MKVVYKPNIEYILNVFFGEKQYEINKLLYLPLTSKSSSVCTDLSELQTWSGRCNVFNAEAVYGTNIDRHFNDNMQTYNAKIT